MGADTTGAAPAAPAPRSRPPAGTVDEAVASTQDAVEMAMDSLRDRYERTTHGLGYGVVAVATALLAVARALEKRP